MKQILTFLVVTASLSACNEQTTTTTVKIDSLGVKVEDGAKKAWDSTKAGAKQLKDKIENKIENIKDSVRTHTDTIHLN
jgi:hypothetical protein